MENLHAQTLPLTGKHLIEASAGTGKTYNITRIYLRMLLERKLPVEQILVMTFTKDATEEIKGRIDDFIREVINHWHELVNSDDYFKSLATRISYEEAMPLLKRALLFLDEAAIFTIHGFCKRVLNQHAFASGVSFSAKMETDCQDIVLQATQDFYRTLAKNDEPQYLLLAQFWQSPESFLTDFNKAIARDVELSQLQPEDIERSFVQLALKAKQQLLESQSILTELLILVKKGKDQETRQQEFDALITWLANIEHSPEQGVEKGIEQAFLPMPIAFFDGRRFARSKNKAQLLEIFSAVIEVKEQQAKLAKSIEKAKAFTVVKAGINIIRTRVKANKSKQSILSFDDLIATLANKLNEEAATKASLEKATLENTVLEKTALEKTGELPREQLSLAQRLYEQYPVALVDEFQDTDPQQFTILQAIYQQQAQAALFMIGDPKQAIYGFRGGDVFAYLAARDNCQYQWLMDTNWRSSAPMVEAYNRVFYGNSLTSEGQAVFGYDISYQPVKASPVAKVRQFDSLALNENTQGKALQFIHFDHNDENKAVPQSFRTVMANWCASEIGRLLSTENAHLPDKLQAQDIAVLVRDGTEAASIKAALSAQNIASVFLSNRANLFHSEQAEQLVSVLKAILFVENDRYFLAGLTTQVLGYSPEKLYQLQHDDLAWQQLKNNFVQLREHWQLKGFISMALKLMHEHFQVIVTEQEENSADRTLTNFLHLFELLQSASQRHRQAQALLFWFEQQIQSDNPQGEAELRLESDDNLIRIVTQHGCKGLEYPVVFIPFSTRYKSPLKFGNRNVNLIEYHDEDKRLCLSLDGDSKAKSAMADEAYAETIRLLYVAITRAEQRCYILTTAFENYHLSPLGQTLKWQAQQDIPQSINTLALDCAEAMSLSKVELDAESTISDMPMAEVIIPEVPTFTSKIERDWWLSSFSALTRNVRHSGLSAPDRDTDNLSASEQLALQNISSLLRFRLTKGARTGNLLHEILEHCDFSQPNWTQALQSPLTQFGKVDFEESEMINWLTQLLKAPLTQGGCLADISWQHTLRESEFYFPMQSASIHGLIEILAEHRQTHVSNVHLPAYKKLKGMMHGFIDLIFQHQGKYYICDYKSSHLGDDYGYYSPSLLKDNIEGNYYDLQYLIYSLALHRQLKFIKDDYDVERDFGGIYYCYLRGMTDDDSYQGCGVYHRSISAKELEQLDHLFAHTEAVTHA